MPDPVLNPDAPLQIPVARPSFGIAEAQAAYNTVRDGWISQGPKVAEFEAMFAEAHGCKFGVACNSGTSALCLALGAAEIGIGDNVVIPTLTMVAVPNAVLFRGATPVFVDSEPETGNADSAWVTKLIRDEVAEPAAVIVPHLYGVPARDFLEESMRFWPNAIIIEDCAESHYANLHLGRITLKKSLAISPAGSLGDIACFSFYSNKIIAGGEGGMACTSDKRLADRMRLLRSHAFTPGEHFRHSELAYGFRFTDLSAAVAIVQHRRRIEFLEKRQAIAERYDKRLIGAKPWLSFPRRPAGSVSWVYPILADSRERRDRVREVLAAAGVETRTYFIPMHQQEHLRRFAMHEYPVAESLAARGCYLPLYPGLTESEIDYICDAIVGIDW